MKTMLTNILNAIGFIIIVGAAACLAGIFVTIGIYIGTLVIMSL